MTVGSQRPQIFRNSSQFPLVKAGYDMSREDPRLYQLRDSSVSGDGPNFCKACLCRGSLLIYSSNRISSDRTSLFCHLMGSPVIQNNECLH